MLKITDDKVYSPLERQPSLISVIVRDRRALQPKPSYHKHLQLSSQLRPSVFHMRPISRQVSVSTNFSVPTKWRDMMKQKRYSNDCSAKMFPLSCSRNNQNAANDTPKSVVNLTVYPLTCGNNGQNTSSRSSFWEFRKNFLRRTVVHRMAGKVLQKKKEEVKNKKSIASLLRRCSEDSSFQRPQQQFCKMLANEDYNFIGMRQKLNGFSAARISLYKPDTNRTKINLLRLKPRDTIYSAKRILRKHHTKSHINARDHDCGHKSFDFR